MVSSLTQEGSTTTFECLELGAFDFVAKPAGGSLEENRSRLAIELGSRLQAFTRTYQVRAYDAPADAPEMAHESCYPSVTVDSLSAKTALDRNSLRPFGADNERSVNIRFVVTEDGRVSIKVYALSGVFVKQLVDDTFTKGIHWSKWDGTNRDGQRVASGVYLITTTMPNRREVQKIAVIK